MDGKLYEEILEALRRQPAIDTHVHMSATNPKAGDIAAALGYGNYMIELAGAGAPKEILGGRKEGEPPPPPEQRVRSFHAAMKLSPHSAHAWMTRQMLAACFGIEGDPSLDDLLRLVRPPLPRDEAARRTREICREKAGIEKIVAAVPTEKKPGDYDDGLFVPMSDFRMPSSHTRKSLDLFEQRVGKSAKDAEELRRISVEALSEARRAGRVAVRMDMGTEHRFARPDPKAASAALDRALAGNAAQADDAALLANLWLDIEAEAAELAGMAVQVFFRGASGGGVALPVYSPDLAASSCELAAAFPKARFEVFCHSDPMQQEMCLAAKHLPNLHLSAAWWYCQFPEMMDRIYGMRLDMLPASKWCGLFTDAYVAEWTAPKSLLHRRELARSLARKVAAGYVRESAVPEIAREVLYDTPRRIYGIQ